MDATMPTATPSLPNYASWGRRAWASTLDAIFLFLILLVVTILFLIVRADANGISLLVSLAYFTIGHGGASGQTPGKRLAHIRVIRDDGGRLGYLKAFLRWLTAIGLTLLLVLPNLIDVLWPLWDAKHQALRDKVAGSIVVRA